MTTRPRGRPRDPSRDRAILRAARAVMAEHGVAGATMEEIAKTAKVGKDTLYRRWPSKEPLVIDVVDTMAREAVRPAPVDPDPRLNLFLYVKDIVRLNERSDFGSLIAGMVGEASRNPDLAVSFRAFWRRRRAVAATLVRDVVGRGAGDEEVETLLDRILGPVYYRLLLTGEPITDEYLWDLVTELPWKSGPVPNAWDSDGSRNDTKPDPADSSVAGAM